MVKLNYFFSRLLRRETLVKAKPSQSSLYAHDVPPTLISVITCLAVRSTIPPFLQEHFPKAHFRNSESVVYLILYTWNLACLIKAWINWASWWLEVVDEVSGFSQLVTSWEFLNLPTLTSHSSKLVSSSCSTKYKIPWLGNAKNVSTK